MNALNRWKIVLTLIAIFVAGAVQPDQRAKLQKLIEEGERRIEQWFIAPDTQLP
jgi:hypothetical protein